VKPVTRAISCSMLAVAAVVALMVPAAASTNPVPSWHLVYKVPGRAHSGILQAVATDPRHAWALGFTGTGNWTPFVVAWNGTTWTKMKPLPPGIGFSLIAASSPSNVWVFGGVSGVTRSPGRAAQWNGHQWVVHPGPDGAGDSAIAVSPSGVLVDSVGNRMEYWDGQAWHSSAYRFPDWQAMTAADGQVWRLQRERIKGQYRLFVQKWAGGTSWGNVSSPHPALSIGRGDGSAISASTPDNVWISVWYSRRSRDRIWHWNGKSWTRVSWGWLQFLGSAGQLTAVGRSSVWAGPGVALWVRGRWRFAGLCGGILAAVPRTNAALCPVSAWRSNPSDTTGEIWQSGSLP
jgi:hypothetical protein